MSIGTYKYYHLLEIGTKIYLVFSSKRVGNKEDIVMMCQVEAIHIQSNAIHYTCRFIKFVVGKYEIKKTNKKILFCRL